MDVQNCSICMSEMGKEDTTSHYFCEDKRHTFHSDCSWEWVKSKLDTYNDTYQKKMWCCPLCRCPPSSRKPIDLLLKENVPEAERAHYNDILDKFLPSSRKDAQPILIVVISILFRITVFIVATTVFTCYKVISATNGLLSRATGLNQKTIVTIETNLILMSLYLRII